MADSSSPTGSSILAQRSELLLSMSYEDPAVRPLLELEGLRQWMEPREEGYRSLVAALDDQKLW